MRKLSTAIAAVVLSINFFSPGISLAGMNRTTDAKLFRLELTLEPAHPIVGMNAAVLVVTDARSNRTIDEAEIELVPWMTVHSHGSPKKPAITRLGSGRYRVENLFFTMEGDWDLLVTLQKGNLRDTATFSVTNVKRR